MTTYSNNNETGVAPSDEEIKVARESGKILASLIGKKKQKVSIQIQGEKNNPSISFALTNSVINLLLSALQEVAKGNSVAVIPYTTELTTQEAANLLRVSRPHFVKLLEDGAISYRKVGAHRRVLYQDLLEYMNKERERRTKVMHELIEETDNLGIKKDR